MEKASEEEKKETDEEKIERLAQEIGELRLQLKEVKENEDPERWVKLCATIEDKDTERILLAENRDATRSSKSISRAILMYWRLFQSAHCALRSNGTQSKQRFTIGAAERQSAKNAKIVAD